MISFNSLGQPLCHQKIVPGNTATGIATGNLIYTQYQVAYTSGGTTVLSKGMWVIGATSAAVGEIVAITITSGTFGGGDAAGIITLKNVVGTWTSGENIKTAGGTNDATLTLVPFKQENDYLNKGLEAKAIMVSVTAQTELALWDGGIPDQTALIGHSLVANSSVTIQNEQAVRDFKVIDYASGSAGTVNVTIYF